jgi:hypothetical protein
VFHSRAAGSCVNDKSLRWLPRLCDHCHSWRIQYSIITTRHCTLFPRGEGKLLYVGCSSPACVNTQSCCHPKIISQMGHVEGVVGIDLTISRGQTTRCISAGLEVGIERKEIVLLVLSHEASLGIFTHALLEEVGLTLWVGDYQRLRVNEGRSGETGSQRCRQREIMELRIIPRER